MICERVAQLLSVCAVINAKGKIIVIDGSLTQDPVATSLIAQGIDRVVSGSALFRDDRLVENTRSWRAMFKVAGSLLSYLHSINAGWRLYLIRPTQHSAGRPGILTIRH